MIGLRLKSLDKIKELRDPSDYLSVLNKRKLMNSKYMSFFFFSFFRCIWRMTLKHGVIKSNQKM
jgi:hypothetical protein